MGYIANPVLREALNINNLDGAEELMTLLQVAVDAASEVVDQICRRTFTLADAVSARVFDAPYRSGVLMVDDIGSESGLAVSVGGNVFTGFTTGPRNAIALGQPVTRLNTVSPWAAGSTITVTARWGWPAVPAAVKQATLRLAVRYFKGKDAPEGQSGWMEQAGALGWQREDPMVGELLAPYVSWSAL